MIPEDSFNHSNYQTLEDLLDKYISPCRLAEDIDRSMLYLVLLMNYEPAHLKIMVPCYESLWELRNLILNQIKN